MSEEQEEMKKSGARKALLEKLLEAIGHAESKESVKNALINTLSSRINLVIDENKILNNTTDYDLVIKIGDVIVELLSNFNLEQLNTEMINTVQMISDYLDNANKTCHAFCLKYNNENSIKDYNEMLKDIVTIYDQVNAQNTSIIEQIQDVDRGFTMMNKILEKEKIELNGKELDGKLGLVQEIDLKGLMGINKLNTPRNIMHFLSLYSNFKYVIFRDIKDQYATVKESIDKIFHLMPSCTAYSLSLEYIANEDSDNITGEMYNGMNMLKQQAIDIIRETVKSSEVIQGYINEHEPEIKKLLNLNN